MKHMPPIFLFILALSLTFGEAGASYNQAQMAGSRSLTICSSSGTTQEIRLGANGRPLSGSGHHSHSCCMFVANAMPVTFVALLPRTSRLQGLVIPVAEIQTVIARKSARARSPPVFV